MRGFGILLVSSVREAAREKRSPDHLCDYLCLGFEDPRNDVSPLLPRRESLRKSSLRGERARRACARDELAATLLQNDRQTDRQTERERDNIYPDTSEHAGPYGCDKASARVARCAGLSLLKIRDHGSRVSKIQAYFGRGS